MWARNLTFVVLCLVGVTAVAAGLLRRNRIEEPRFDPWAAKAGDFREVVDQIDAEFEASWRLPADQDEIDLGDGPATPVETETLPVRVLDHALPAGDLAIARRLSLGLCGTVPSLEELRAFEAQNSEHRIEWWLARLLQDRRSADFLAERLARAYVGTENGPFIVFRRRRFVTWLSDRLAENKPYDELVRAMIGDRGLWTDMPAVNFVTVTLDGNENNQPDPIRLAGRTTRAFLGMRIDCLQCHDDQLGKIDLGTPDDPRDGLQSDFHQLAAFFGQCESSLLGIRDGEGQYEYKYLDAEAEEVVEPAPPFLPELMEPSSGDDSRRERLARWVTHPGNKPFARATVNRVWALMFGRPLHNPVDDIPLNGPFPPGMETLAEDFIEHDYDLRRLIRLIAATRVFRQDSRAVFEITPEHEAKWAVFPITRLRPEQVAGALIQSCSIRTIDANAHIFSQLARFGQQSDFIRRYGDMGEDEFVDRGGTVAQRLLMMNGNLLKERTKRELTNASNRIATLAPDDARAVETAYLAVLTRPPSPAELNHFVPRLQGVKGDARAPYLEDLYWVLLNSTEFSWNH